MNRVEIREHFVCTRSIELAFGRIRDKSAQLTALTSPRKAGAVRRRPQVARERANAAENEDHSRE